MPWWTFCRPKRIAQRPGRWNKGTGAELWWTYGCGSKWKTDVGPQMEMSSLVLTIQLLGYLILTHNHIFSSCVKVGYYMILWILIVILRRRGVWTYDYVYIYVHAHVYMYIYMLIINEDMWDFDKENGDLDIFWHILTKKIGSLTI